MSLFWFNGLFAKTPPLTKLSSAYYERALSLPVNPNELKNKLVKPINAVELAQHYLLLSLADNYLVLPNSGLKNAERGLAELEGLTQPWLKHSLTLAKASAMDLMGQTSQAIPFANQAVKWAELNQRDQLLVDALSVRGMLHNTLLNSTGALIDLQRAYTLASIDDPFAAKGAIASSIAFV